MRRTDLEVERIDGLAVVRCLTRRGEQWCKGAGWVEECAGEWVGVSFALTDPNRVRKLMEFACEDGLIVERVGATY